MKLVENSSLLKRPVWLGIRILFFFALFVVIGLLPALSVIPASAVPPLDAMQRSAGTISFRSVGGRSGALTIIEKSGGDRDEFSCRENMQGLHNCIHSRYAGGFGQIYWFWVRTPFGGSYKFPAQIVVKWLWGLGHVPGNWLTRISPFSSTRIKNRFTVVAL